MNRWLLEQNAEGEIYTFPETTEQNICNALDTNYAALMDTTDESCIWCFGEFDRRIIEIRTPEVKGVVAMANSKMSARLTRQQAETIFKKFFHSKSLPVEFQIMQGSIMYDNFIDILQVLKEVK